VLLTRGGTDAAEKLGPTTRVSATPLIVPPPVQVADHDLPGLLLAPDQITTIVSAQLDPQPPVANFANDANSVAPSTCISVLLPAQKLTFSNTGFSAVYYQTLGPNKDGFSAFEGVVSFPTAELAGAFATRQSEIWQQCADSLFTVFGDDAKRYSSGHDYKLGSPQLTGQIAFVVAKRVDKSLGCQHVVTSVGNVVVDAIACLPPTVTDQAVNLARAIAAKAH
jgi:eukaryotic-like serine/threonine-protein kinase